jgi:lauroyl/myristoyl acyltransferase
MRIGGWKSIRRHIAIHYSPLTIHAPAPLSSWKSFRYRLEARACLLLAQTIPRLSRRHCVKLSWVLGDLAYALDGRGRSVARENLTCAFGERFTPAQRRTIARASYRNFVRTMMDLFWAQRLTAESWRKWIEPVGFDAVRDQLAGGARGAIFLCVHQGNWEWASLVCGWLGFGNVVVAENFKNPLLTGLFATLRQHSGQTIIAQENSLLRMLKIVKRGGATGMLIDLNLRPAQAATIIEGFGLEMCVPLLHAVLAQRAGALLVPVVTEPRDDGTVRVVARSAIEVRPEMTVEEIAQQCWAVFEPLVRSRPDLYLWAYKHFRYRPKAAPREYPGYAHESGAYEKLRRSIQGKRLPERP